VIDMTPSQSGNHAAGQAGRCSVGLSAFYTGLVKIPTNRVAAIIFATEACPEDSDRSFMEVTLTHQHHMMEEEYQRCSHFTLRSGLV
jgi:hypothetical protein